jgi:hypothetical protein
MSFFLDKKERKSQGFRRNLKPIFSSIYILSSGGFILKTSKNEVLSVIYFVTSSKIHLFLVH